MEKKTEQISRRGFLGKVGLGIVGAGAAVVASKIPEKAEEVVTVPADQLGEFAQGLLDACREYGSWSDKIRKASSLNIGTPPDCDPAILTLRSKGRPTIIHIQLPKIEDIEDYRIDSEFTRKLLVFIQGKTGEAWSREYKSEEFVTAVFDPKKEVSNT